MLDLPLPLGVHEPCRGRVADVDSIVRTAERDEAKARDLLLTNIEPGARGETDLPDLLAHHLSVDASLGIGQWAERKGVARATAWRQFRKAYGVDIAAYRLRLALGQRGG